MNANETIIDVTPIEYSSSKGTSRTYDASRASSAYGTSHVYDSSRPNSAYGASRPSSVYSAQGTSHPNSAFGHTRASSRSAQYQQPTWRPASAFHGDEANPRQAHYGSAYTRFGGQTVVSQADGPALGGLVQMAIGAGLVMIGVPMLILPGPGLLSILGGMALIGNGMRKAFGLQLR